MKRSGMALHPTPGLFSAGAPRGHLHSVPASIADSLPRRKKGELAKVIPPPMIAWSIFVWDFVENLEENVWNNSSQNSRFHKTWKNRSGSTIFILWFLCKLASWRKLYADFVGWTEGLQDLRISSLGDISSLERFEYPGYNPNGELQQKRCSLGILCDNFCERNRLSWICVLSSPNFYSDSWLG